MRGSVSIDAVNKRIYFAVARSDGFGGPSRTRVYRSVHGQTDTWEHVYTPPVTSPFGHDHWGASIAAKHEPNGPAEGDVAVTYYTTERDFASVSRNEYPDINMATSEAGGALGTWQSGDLTGFPSWIMQAPWGSRTATWGHPYYHQGAFWAAWADDRDVAPKTEVWAAAGLHN